MKRQIIYCIFLLINSFSILYGASHYEIVLRSVLENDINTFKKYAHYIKQNPDDLLFQASLHIAAEYNNMPMLITLLETGVPPHKALKIGHLNPQAQLLPQLTASTAKPKTPLTRSLEKNHLAITDKLIKWGAKKYDISAITKDTDPKIIKLLVDCQLLERTVIPNSHDPMLYDDDWDGTNACVLCTFIALMGSPFLALAWTMAE